MTKTEVVWAGFVSVAGTIASTWLGGWNTPLKLLIFLLIADYVTGILKGIKQKSLDSDIMFWGGIRKVATIFVLAMCTMLDELMNNSSPVFRTLAVYFYAGREGLSVVENLGAIGMWLPPQIKQVLTQLQDKGG